jgi:hypothetical protein
MSDLHDASVNVVAGFCAGSRQRLIQLTNVQDWRALAQMELNRRQALVLQSFEADALLAVLDGEIKMDAVLRAVSERMHNQ